MVSQTVFSSLALCVILFFLVSTTPVEAYVNTSTTSFVQCMASASPTSYSNIYDQTSPQFLYIFESTQQQSRRVNTSSLFPDFIITPSDELDIQAAVKCSRKFKYEVRVRSGGHDYEGLSYRSQVSYIVLDMVHLRKIIVDVAKETAWVQAGATLGELYYTIAQYSPTLAFPGGTAPSVGTGGLISGGGWGWLFRKYGLAADNVLDARVVDCYGRVLDGRESMGEDLFWAIRGGGGASFGIITSWKLRLVRVPPIVTTFTKVKLLNESGTELIYQWQSIAPQLPNNLVIRILASLQFGREGKYIRVSFNSLFQGNTSQLLVIMKERFPALGLMESDCYEMPYVNTSIQYWGAKNGSEKPLIDVLNRTDKFRGPYKAKSDFVFSPNIIPKSGFEGIWELFLNAQGGSKGSPLMILEPFGGKMDEFSPTSLPFPYRNGTLYNIQYLFHWESSNPNQGSPQIKWIKELYEYMAPYVSHSPRSAYLNYRDLDLGINPIQGPISFSEAQAWGEKYLCYSSVVIIMSGLLFCFQHLYVFNYNDSSRSITSSFSFHFGCLRL